MLAYVKRKHYELVQNVKPRYRQKIIIWYKTILWERENLIMSDIT